MFLASERFINLIMALGNMLLSSKQFFILFYFSIADGYFREMKRAQLFKHSCLENGNPA
jgi:hypothetical protein